MFTIKFKQEFIRCCYGRFHGRRSDGDGSGIRRSLLLPLQRNSESSSSSVRHSDRLSRHAMSGLDRAGGSASAPGWLGHDSNCSNQTYRYSYMTSFNEVKTSSSRSSLNSLPRDSDRERVNFISLRREDRDRCNAVSIGSDDRVNFVVSMSDRFGQQGVPCRDDRANLNNFIRNGIQSKE